MSPESSDKGRVQVPWVRRQWLKVIALAEDHPRASLTLVLLPLVLLIFYGTQLGGFSHFGTSFSRWRVDTFGGELEVNRSVRTPDVILSFSKEYYNRLDAVSLTASHLKGTAFRKELRALVSREGGLIRIVALDPRVSDPDHPQHQRFLDLAKAFGMAPLEFGARCWHSAAVLHQLKRELKEGIQLKWLSEPSSDATYPYFCIGRSGHAYHSDDPSNRLDVIVPRPEIPVGGDSFTHPGKVIKNRPENPDVVRSTRAFENLWSSAATLKGELQQELSKRIDGTPVTGD